jgi:hypothetical protein
LPTCSSAGSQIANAFHHHAARSAPVEREPGFLRTEGRWLAGVVLGVGVAVGIAIASVALVKSTTSNNPETKASPSASGTPIKVQAVHDFDPFGDGAEHSKDAERAADGNDTTAWFTLQYKTAGVGGKKGVGLVFDLGSSSRVGSMTIASTLAGWRAEIRMADEDGDSPDDFRVVKNLVAGTNTTVELDQPTSGRYWLIWITRLAATSSNPDLPFEAAIAEVRFLPA